MIYHLRHMIYHHVCCHTTVAFIKRLLKYGSVAARNIHGTFYHNVIAQHTVSNLFLQIHPCKVYLTKAKRSRPEAKFGKSELKYSIFK